MKTVQHKRHKLGQNKGLTKIHAYDNLIATTCEKGQVYRCFLP